MVVNILEIQIGDQIVNIFLPVAPGARVVCVDEKPGVEIRFYPLPVDKLVSPPGEVNAFIM